MIWLLMNTWWLVPALVALGAVVALALGVGVPVLRSLALRVPAQAWAALGAVLAVSLAASWLIGIGEQRCRAKFEAAEAKADLKAAEQHKKADTAREAATTTIAKESSDAVAQVHTIVRTVPATCPPMPDELRYLLQRQVEGANAGVPAG